MRCKETITVLKFLSEGTVLYTLWERLEGRWLGYLVPGLSTVVTVVLLILLKQET